MKVLHLPENIASFISETVSLENTYSSIEAKGVVYSDERIDSVDYENVEVRSKNNYEIKYKPKWFLFGIKQKTKLLKDLMWADVIHWYWSDRIFSDEFEFKLIRLLKKPVIIEWLGSEIRDHQIECDHNRFYRSESVKNPEIISLFCGEKSKKNQINFKKLNALPVMVRGASILYHLDKVVFPKVFETRHRIDIRKYSPFYVSRNNSCPLIVHAPTDKNIKGTSYILSAIQKLKEEGLNFKFELIENLTRKQVKEKMAACDIYVDQLLCGGYGMAATEALALAKPVISYLHETSLKELPANCPIVNANPDTIYEVLKDLLLNPARREEVSILSRKYAEEYYDPTVICNELQEVYKYALSN